MLKKYSRAVEFTPWFLVGFEFSVQCFVVLFPFCPFSCGQDIELSVILLLRFVITLLVSSGIVCHSSSTIFDYPFGIFVNYLSFFYDF